VYYCTANPKHSCSKRPGDQVALNSVGSVGLQMVSDGIVNTSLKGQCHEIFCFWFFPESVSPQAQSIALGPFQIFSKIHGDIHKLRCTTSINDTGGKFFHQFS
jgi:hypothetical protein